MTTVPRANRGCIISLPIHYIRVFSNSKHSYVFLFILIFSYLRIPQNNIPQKSPKLIGILDDTVYQRYVDNCIDSLPSLVVITKKNNNKTEGVVPFPVGGRGSRCTSPRPLERRPTCTRLAAVIGSGVMLGKWDKKTSPSHPAVNGV